MGALDVVYPKSTLILGFLNICECPKFLIIWNWGSAWNQERRLGLRLQKISRKNKDNAHRHEDTKLNARYVCGRSGYIARNYRYQKCDSQSKIHVTEEPFIAILTDVFMVGNSDGR